MMKVIAAILIISLFGCGASGPATSSGPTHKTPNIDYTGCRKPDPDPPIPAGAPPGSTWWSVKNGVDQDIPARFQGGASVSVDFLSASEVNRICAGGIAVCGRTFYACTNTQKKHLTVPNPCDFKDESFAETLCHELAHINGWPATHGP